MDEFLTVTQVAAILNVHVNTLKRIKPETLPYFRFGKRGDRRYLRSSVESYIDKNSTESGLGARVLGS